MHEQQDQLHWFIWLNGKHHGPYTFTALMEAVAKGIITGDTGVWRLGWANWHLARRVPGLINEPLEETEIDARDAEPGDVVYDEEDSTQPREQPIAGSVSDAA
jgi:hypothetical protein